MKISINKCMYLYGLMCTFASLILAAGNIAINNFLFILLIFVLLLTSKRLYLNKSGIILLWSVLLLEFLFSSVLAWYDGNKLWSSSLIISIKCIVYIGAFILLVPSQKYSELYSNFVDGLYIGCVIQCLWAIFQAICYHVGHIFVNDILFENAFFSATVPHIYLKLTDGVFRCTGLSWEPANLAFCMIFGFIFTKSSFMKCLFCVSLLLTGSRTSAFLLLLLFFFDALYRVFIEKKIAFNFRKVVCGFGFVLLMLVFLFMFKDNKYLEIVVNSIDRMSTLFAGLSDSSALRHAEYYFRLNEIVASIDIKNWIFGLGTFIAGNAITNILGIYPFLADKPWNPESDFVTLMIGNGFAGLILYYVIIIISIRKCFRMRDKENFLLLILMAFAGITYIYIRSTWFMMLLFLISLHCSLYGGDIKASKKILKNIKRNTPYHG